MGDPKKIRSKYETPVHPWQKERLEEEKSLAQIYGLVNKKEVYKADSKLKKFKQLAKGLASKSGDQAVVERKQLFDKLKSLNLVHEENLDLVLGLKIEQILDRRLQTVLFKKGLARTIKQARQMIVHRHILVNGKKITSPSYLVKVEEEDNIVFYPGSGFADEEHPERKPKETVNDKEVKQEDKSKATVKETDVKEESKEVQEAQEKKPETKEEKADDKKIEEKETESEDKDNKEKTKDEDSAK